jgi:hypothetical protein
MGMPPVEAANSGVPAIRWMVVLELVKRQQRWVPRRKDSRPPKKGTSGPERTGFLRMLSVTV